MRTLILPDIHNKTKKVDKILNNYWFDKIIFTGDFFDDFGDNPEIVKGVAEWLKDKIEELGESAVWLLGNHDMGYAFPNNASLRCSGWTRNKCNEINSVLKREDWNKFKLCHFQDNFLFSHGGVHPYIFADAMQEITIGKIEAKCRQAIIDAKSLTPSMITMAGESRGGGQDVGGITWLDWDEEFEPIPNINQVVGHTPHPEPDYKIGENSINYNLDTHLHHIGMIVDGVFKYETLDNETYI